MTLLAGLDINASRARAVGGSPPQPIALGAGSNPELPLALSLEGRRVEVGAAGVQLCRRYPHLVCAGFLPHLGAEREWTAGRHRLTACQALTHVFKHVQGALTEVAGLALVLPGYLSRAQRALAGELAKQARLPLLGTIAAPLAAAWAARAHRPWFGPAILLDVDEQALCWTAVTVDEPPAAPQARILAERTVPALGMLAWKERLLIGIADRCIRQSRRDPRANGTTEQGLYEQFDIALEACGQGRLVELVIQSENWYQDLILRPGEIEHYCAGLVQQAIAQMRRLRSATRTDQPPALVVLTASAARLPGLVRALHAQTGLRTQIVTLAPIALAQAAHELAAGWFAGTLPRGPIETVIPVKHLPRARAGPARPPGPNQPTRLPPRKNVAKAPHADDDFSVLIDE